MPDLINADGLQVKTATEILADLTAAYKNIYGNDINVEQNSPDGQNIGIITQMNVDLREILTMINAGFDPDQAVGVVLDQRVTINNITRKGGTYTIQSIDLVITETVTLAGLDADFNNADGVGYTIADDAGNEWILIDTETFIAGAYSRNFRARKVGQVETVIGTITKFVTVVLGVTSVINSVGVLSTGTDEETDAELRVRRQRSVAIASNGYLNGIEGALLNVEGVSNAKVYENITNVVDADGIPAHAIWCIVGGGANTDIGTVIFTKKTAGANMKGAVTVDFTTISGTIFTAKFDRPTSEDLYMRFDIQKTDPAATFDQAAIKTSIVVATSYEIGEFAETSSLTATASTAITENGGGGVPVNMEVSDDGVVWIDYLETSTKDKQFVVDTTRITITVL
ncbi:MAG: hypothetical protein COB09_19110 [Thalassobium sp.]|nr:MAG: hypothetical protein COB09_19110 [Thalassobium sp.]